jgi:hypothetical protein
MADQSIKDVTSFGEGDWETDAEEDEDAYRLAGSLLSTLIPFQHGSVVHCISLWRLVSHTEVTRWKEAGDPADL